LSTLIRLHDSPKLYSNEQQNIRSSPAPEQLKVNKNLIMHPAKAARRVTRKKASIELGSRKIPNTSWPEKI